MLIRRIARPMLSATFIARGVDTLRNPDTAVDAARSTLTGLSAMPGPVGPEVPNNAATIAKANAAIQVGGGLLLALGKAPRLTSAALAVTLIPGSLGAQVFRREAEPQRAADQRREFLTDISLLGGLIIAAVDTEGKPSLAWRGRRAAKHVSATVAGALPSVAAGNSLTDGALAEKISHGLSVGAEKSRELTDVAWERASDFAETARDHAPEIADAARERAAGLAKVARNRAPELAEAARDRGADLAALARDRGAELAEVARDRSAELADVTRDRSAELADQARTKAKKAKKAAKR